MIAPQYWSESKAKRVVDGQQFTVKRFGWSDIGEQEAKAHADSRLNDALETLEKDRNVRRIDHKTSYNGAEGIPIREEVISRHEDNVITRNGYGALCLNTPDVLFADIDFDYDIPIKLYVFIDLLLLVCNMAISYQFNSWGVFIAGFFAMIFTIPVLTRFIHKLVLKLKGGVDKIALNRIKKISAENPELHLRVYRTPMGYRVLAMQALYQPQSDATIALLKAFNTDEVYVLMCKNQNCFRARLSPKPWRMGVSRLKPNPGVWPIKQQHMAQRQTWVEQYNTKAVNYASCRFVMHLGSDVVVDKAESVRQIHDAFCKVDETTLKLA